MSRMEDTSSLVGNKELMFAGRRNLTMTELLERAIAQLKTLPPDEQLRKKPRKVMLRSHLND